MVEIMKFSKSVSASIFLDVKKLNLLGMGVALLCIVYHT